jgi:hypothetical protein
VDYGCPDGTAAWVAAHFPQVRVVRVTDDPGFRAARARNLGAAATQSEWIAFFDADVLLAPGLFARLVPTLAAGNYYLPDSGDPNAWGSCFVERSAFVAAGGYDEAIDGWGGEDNDLYMALGLRGVGRRFYPGALVTPIRHSDEERLRFHAAKSVPLATRLNAVYRAIKFDAMRLLSRPLELDERRSLRERARAMVEAARAPGPAAPGVRIDLPERELVTRFTPPGRPAPRLRAHVFYELVDGGEPEKAVPGDGSDSPQQGGA